MEQEPSSGQFLENDFDELLAREMEEEALQSYYVELRRMGIEDPEEYLKQEGILDLD